MGSFSHYIIYGIEIQYSHGFKQRGIDYYKLVEDGKPIEDYPLYYIGKCIGKANSAIPLYKNEGKDRLEATVVSHQDGIAVIRVHNPKEDEIISKPNEDGSLPASQYIDNYPYAFLVIDYRVGKLQIAIQCTTAFGYKTETLKNSVNLFFDIHLNPLSAIDVSISEKYFPQKSIDFIKERVNNNDWVKSFKFKYERAVVAADEHPTGSQVFIRHASDLLRDFGATFGEATLNFDTQESREAFIKEKLDQLCHVINYSKNRMYDVRVDFCNSGTFTLGAKGVVAKIPMHDDIISNATAGGTSPTHPSKENDLKTWLDDVFNQLLEKEKE